MKSKWLLLMVSVLCVMVLFPAAALSQGPTVTAGCGSATVDAGIGAAAALDWKFLDQNGSPVPASGGTLQQIARIASPQQPISAPVNVLCDVRNPLCGRNGAARTYGPQKGATPQMVDSLERGLEHLAQLVRAQLGKDIDIPGAGAAGGLAGGAVAFMNAKLTSGVKAVMDFTGLKAELADADWIVTGEGCFDRQSLYGKVVSGIAELAARSNVPVAVIAGQINLSQTNYQDIGIRTAIGCKPPTMSLENAIANSHCLLEAAARSFAKQNLV